MLEKCDDHRHDSENKRCAGTAATVQRMRGEGLEAWMKRFGHVNEAEGHWDRLLRRGQWSASEADDIIKYLDQCCSRETPSESALETKSDIMSTRQPQIVFPDFLAIPDLSKKPEMNAFVEHLKEKYPQKNLEKQIKFQQALLDAQKALMSCQLPFFLCCGTALGAHREQSFIDHDDDIDLGIDFHNLIRLGLWGNKNGVTRVSAGLMKRSDALDERGEDEDETRAASDGLVELLAVMSNQSLFAVFDICGKATRGLEVRLLHLPTRVRLDINVYYPPIPMEDDDLVKRHGDFVWASSFYEEASRRRHGMYRYRHAPFVHKLVRVPFCSLSGDEAEGFFVPPISYLQEYFGDQWRTPKVFSYAEGLEHEFRNIVDE